MFIDRRPMVASAVSLVAASAAAAGSGNASVILLVQVAASQVAAETENNTNDLGFTTSDKLVQLCSGSITLNSHYTVSIVY
jgi:hypothetical protein